MYSVFPSLDRQECVWNGITTHLEWVSNSSYQRLNLVSSRPATCLLGSLNNAFAFPCYNCLLLLCVCLPAYPEFFKLHSLWTKWLVLTENRRERWMAGSHVGHIDDESIFIYCGEVWVTVMCLHWFLRCSIVTSSININFWCCLLLLSSSA